jgi:hypothetical protein
MTRQDLLLVITSLLGGSGWAAAIASLIWGWKKNIREEREDQRKAGEALRAEKDRCADLVEPFHKELSTGDWLARYEEWERNSDRNKQGKPRTEGERNDLKNYPAKLEDIGVLLVAGRLSPGQVYDHFGKEILTCKRADRVWGDEDRSWWRLFDSLADSMERQEALHKASRA